jgi:hypothetical protein
MGADLVTTEDRAKKDLGELELGVYICHILNLLVVNTKVRRRKLNRDWGLCMFWWVGWCKRNEGSCLARAMYKFGTEVHKGRKAPSSVCALCVAGLET